MNKYYGRSHPLKHVLKEYLIAQGTAYYILLKFRAFLNFEVICV